VVVSPRVLASELCCPICLDLLNTTMTTKVPPTVPVHPTLTHAQDCLHRFCNECISQALKCNKECPTCRKRLASRRSLRPDPNFDAIIAKIFPSRDAYNEAQKRAQERFNQQCSSQVGIISKE